MADTLTLNELRAALERAEAQIARLAEAHREMRAALDKLQEVERDRRMEEQAKEEAPGDECLSLPAASELLGVSRPTITSNLDFFMDQGIRFRRVSQHRMKVSRKSIEEFLERHQQTKGD